MSGAARRNPRQSQSRIFDALRGSAANGAAFLTDDVENAWDPNAIGIKLWHHVLLGCILFEAFVLTFFFMFKPNAPMEQPREFYGVVACEFLFLLDIIIQAHTGYYHDGNVVLDTAKTRRRYLRSWVFALDVFTLVPFSYFFHVGTFARATLELHKLLRCIKMPRYVAMLDDTYAKHFVVIKLLKMVISTVYLSHFVACLRFSFGYNEGEENEWLPQMPDHHQTVQREYLMSLFWAFGVLTGLVEGKLSTTIAEFLFTIFVAICGFTLFTMLCAMFFMISKCESGNSEAAEAQINQLRHLLSFHHVPDNLQRQAIEYLKRYYTDVESNDREVMNLLCPSITKDIQVELVKGTVSRIPLLGGCQDTFIVELTSLLELLSVPAHTTIFTMGEYGDSMFIVQSGVLNVFVNGVKVRELRKGTPFGELSVFSDIPRSATTISATYSTLYKLSRYHAERLLVGYPVSAMAIKRELESLRYNGTGSRRSASRGNSSKMFDLKKGDSTMIGTKLKNQASVTPLFSRGKRASYVLPGVEDVPEDTANPTPNDEADDHAVMLNNYFDRKVAETATKSEPGVHPIFRKLLFRRCIDAQSSFRFWWLLVLEIVQGYNWITIPLRLCFPVFDRPMPALYGLDIVTDILLFVDIYLNFNLSYVANSEKIMDTSQSAMHYLKRGFVFDLLCLLPFWAPSTTILRLPRIVRSFTWYAHYIEVSAILELTNRARLLVLCLLLLMLYHGIACLHFGISNIEGFSHEEEAWIPCEDIYLKKVNDTHYRDHSGTLLSVDDNALHEIATTQYFRSLYYATNVLAALGKTIEPESDFQYASALAFMLSGFLITAIVVDNVQKRFTASAYEQKQFYAMRTQIQLFLRRQNAPREIFQRVNSFLDFWWSSHRGAFIGELLADLPAPVKKDILRSICSPALQSFGLLAGVRPVLDKLEEFFVVNAKFILYGQGEVVYRQGDYANGLYFLLEGEVCVIANAQNPRSVQHGGFFGTAVFHAGESAEGYGEHVSATKGCILLFISRDHIRAMEADFPQLSDELLELEAKLLRNKRTQSSFNASDVIKRQSSVGVASTPATGVSLWLRWFGGDATAFDPDSKFIILWETWLFIAMTVQWLAVTIQICYRVKAERYVQADIMTAVLELSFFFDVYVRSRLGYYAYGNKVMDLRTIRASYFRSRVFVIDVLSLTPLYVVNWFRPVHSRLDSLNVNKIMRVLKVSGQLRALENRNLKHTTELRLFKLFYYTFLLAHIFGCMWFDFASNASHIFNSSPTQETEFGDDHWLPPADLEFAQLNLQYFASLFWSFGLMSAASTGELPKTTHECIFTVLTMTTGFFLFAYVVGNFTDIIELSEGADREFIERLSAMRLLLSHFSLPKTIEERLKTYICFIRFHTITHEHHLERCLPPSLLTDIRLVHLKPMIDKVAFLSGMEGSVTRMLVSQFSQMLVLRDEYVCKFGDEGSDMFFVFTGVLDVLLPHAMVGADEVEDELNPDEKLRRETATACAFDSEDPLMGKLKKANELTAGSYFGENGLFTKSLRNAYVRASTSCILYKLSRESLDLVFDRYPQWKEKVLRIANLQHEQQRLARLSAEEQHRHSDEANGSMLSRIDLLNRRAEQLEEQLNLVRYRRSDSSLTTNSQLSKARSVWNHYLLTPARDSWHSLVHGAHAQSPFHRRWLQLTLFCTLYIAFLVPYRVSVDKLDRSTGVAPFLQAVQVFCEVIFAVDIWFSWRVRVSAESMELYEQSYRLIYRKERFKWDVIAAVPLDRLFTEFTHTYWLRLLRCLKVRNLVGYMAEVNRRSVSIEANRFRGVCLLYVLAIHWAGCAYLATCMNFGFGDKWSGFRPSTTLEIGEEEDASSEKIMLRFLRGFMFGATAFFKKGITFTPDATPLLIFTVSISFTGMLVLSYMIGEFASLYISRIWNEVVFRKHHIAVELYLDRVKVSDELKQRAHRFMSTLWSSHSGVNYEHIFQEMPESLKQASIMHIAQRPLRLFMSSTFRLLATDSMKDLEAFTHALAQSLRFEGYPRDEDIVKEGSISRAMYFVVRGHLVLSSASNPTIKRSILRKGVYFGDRGLLGCAVSGFSVRTVRACDMLSLSSETLLKIIKELPFTQVAYILVQRAQASLYERKLAGCSREDMEERWSKAILQELVQLGHETRQTSSSLLQPMSVSATHVQRLSRAIAGSTTDCMRVFESFLGLVLPFDPLDCSALGGPTSIAPTETESSTPTITAQDSKPHSEAREIHHETTASEADKEPSHTDNGVTSSTMASLDTLVVDTDVVASPVESRASPAATGDHVEMGVPESDAMATPAEKTTPSADDWDERAATHDEAVQGGSAVLPGMTF